MLKDYFKWSVENLDADFNVYGNYELRVNLFGCFKKGIIVGESFTFDELSQNIEDCLNFGLQSMIDKVIFNDPATIVKWKDGTKTVVKVQDGETFDPMVGLAMCISKKAMGNQGNYFEVFKKYCEPWYEEKRIQEFNETIMDGSLGEIFEKIRKALSRGFEDGLKVKAQESPKDDERVYFAKVTAPRVCLTCKYCVKHDGSYCCTNANVSNAGTKNVLFPDCNEWEAMSEPKDETDEK